MKLQLHKNNYSDLPVNLFGCVMGLTGLALAYRLASEIFDFPQIYANIIGFIAMMAFVILFILYILKAIKYPRKVMDEFNHPIIGNFFGTIPIGILLLSSFLKQFIPYTSTVIWFVGAVLMIIMVVSAIYKILSTKQKFSNATPAYLIPGVGTLDIVATIPDNTFTGLREIIIISFGVGVVLAITFFILIFARLMYCDNLPSRLKPTLMILIAPFAVGFLAYTAMEKNLDTFSLILLGFSLFLCIIVSIIILLQKLQFMLTWWAVSFPLAAFSNSFLKYAMFEQTLISKVIALLILLVVTIVMSIILIKSLDLFLKGKLFTF
ncbi:SLAC1 anion channel family protein [Chryseobacterium sp. SG20098]|uniref:SLAC1 anion channel family protein n=1 Tax=Chryseobacterium sp. SG20098 TaxID=3074145 RepID=UPI002882D82D|nr:SLAC1 anion channel family protein [Chryseobacterium sp. SG20098]WNI36461.1 SLAC1 anion channel family protein [Chryseobacterium sp. SG20098]